jgi:hypothetical protein
MAIAIINADRALSIFTSTAWFPTVGKEGPLYFAQDTEVTYRWDVNSGTYVEFASATGGGGVTDHGLLTGLADDDHPQYALDTNLDNYQPLNATLTAIADATLGAFGHRNKIINNNFAVNQRVVTGTVTLAAGVYGHDRWKAGAGGCTYTFATAANVTTLTISAGTLMQVIEGANLLSGTHVLSWTGTALARVDSGSYGASGLTGTAVGGTNQTIEFATGTVSKVQYEPGSVATPFEHRSYGVELDLCKRYHRPIHLFGGQYSTTGGALAANATGMRATPTFVAEFWNRSGVGVFTPSTIDTGPSTADYIVANITFTAAGAVGTPLRAPGYLSAEL